MKTAKYANTYLNSGSLNLGAVKGEVEEVFEAIQKRDFTELKEEIADVIYFSLCLLEQETGINLPLIGAMSTLKKVEERIKVWESIFAKEGLVFKPSYLTGGSNYKKQVKVNAALELAKEDQAK